MRSKRERDTGEASGDGASDQKAIDTLLQAAEHPYYPTVRHTHDLIALIDQTGAIVYASPSHLDVLGHDPAALIGRSVFDFVHPIDLAAVMEQWPPQAVEGTLHTVFRLRHADSSWRWVEISATAVMHSGEHQIICIARDITSHQQTERSFVRLQRHYELILNAAGEGIIGLDTNGDLTFANPAAARMLGWNVVDLIGQSMHTLVYHTKFDGTPRLEAHSPISATLVEGRISSVADDLFWRKDGTSFPVEYTSTPICEGGVSVGAVVVFQNIRARKELEARLLQAQKMDSIGRLAGGITHDLNNVLAVISGYTDLARHRLPVGSLIHRDLVEIQKAADRAAALNKQLLTFARKQTVEPRVFNLNDLLLDVSKLLRRLIDATIEFVILPSADLGLIRADPGQIEQVIVNLVVNARDAMTHGGKLTIKTANITLDHTNISNFPTALADATGAFVLLSITDTGTGMSDEVKAHVFEPFFTTKEAGRGTGIGLATCYGIVRQHGGYITIDSEPGQGTTMRVFMPRVEAEADHVFQIERSYNIPLGTETILVVEDEPSVRVFLSNALRQQGYTVLEAASGAEALRVFRRRVGSAIDLVLTDVLMPQMGGVELLHQLRYSHPNIKILFISGYMDEVVMRGEQPARSVAFLQKPFTLATLAQKVREVLDT
jgi:PAS domain S-box-containing protein